MEALSVQLRFLGCGDAFGSGGRLNTCFLVNRGDGSFLIDCGASAMISIRRFGVDPNRIGAIILSHLHADHYGGLPSFILDAQLISRRSRPLVIAGPEGLGGRLDTLMEAHFPGSTRIDRKFPLELLEIPTDREVDIGSIGVRVSGHTVVHPSGAPSLALRIECDDKIIAYTGDTEWVDTLLSAGRDADLLIAEAYYFERKVRFHLDYATLRRKLAMIGAKRVILTHMSPDMLGRISGLQDCEAAHDGLEVEIGDA
jgi:ribonuclease BN (tRNA processing enzyme)